MRIEIEIPEYDYSGVDVFWEKNAKYNISCYDDEVVLAANKEGLISLAKQMLYFAYNDLPKGSHVHFDSFFTGQSDIEHELVLCKINNEH